jgi:hypothetical protein
MPWMPGTPRRYSRRSDLFLVRVWTVETSQNSRRTTDTGVESSNSDSNDGESAEWRGKVQRVVSGESHEFNSMQGLVELLKLMLSKSERR